MLPTRASTATCATERRPESAAVAGGIDGIPDLAGHLPLWQAGHVGDHARGRDDGDRVEIAGQSLAANPDLIRDDEVQLFLRQLLLSLGAQILGLGREADAKQPAAWAKRCQNVHVRPTVPLDRLAGTPPLG